MAIRPSLCSRNRMILFAFQDNLTNPKDWEEEGRFYIVEK